MTRVPRLPKSTRCSQMPHLWYSFRYGKCACSNGSETISPSSACSKNLRLPINCYGPCASIDSLEKSPFTFLNKSIVLTIIFSRGWQVIGWKVFWLQSKATIKSKSWKTAPVKYVPRVLDKSVGRAGCTL